MEIQKVVGEMWSTICNFKCPHHCYALLTASFQDNLGKPVPECQTILGFATARDSGDGQNSETCADLLVRSDHHNNQLFYRPVNFLLADQQCQSTEIEITEIRGLRNNIMLF